MPTAGACPDVSLIRQLAARKLAPADKQSVLAHVAHCPACAQKLKALREAPAAGDQETLRPQEPARVPRLQTTCAACGKAIKVKPELAGKTIRCPHCKQPVHVPAGAAAAPGEEPETQLPASPGVATCTYQAPKAQYDFLAPAEAPDELGRLGPYRVLQVLGAGGMGVVFRAEDPQLARLVALKAMLPTLAASDSARQRFLREARAVAAIKHDHIVTIHQVGEDRGVPFLAMEFLEGEPLDVRLQREGKLPVPEVLRIGGEIAQALAAAHQRDLIHRDIKPANIWLETSPGEPAASTSGGRVKLLDFGLARAVSEGGQLTQQGAIVGTPAYMAPEQAQGLGLDARCDLFSLGCVLYRMATGEPAFKGTDIVSTLMAVATHDPPAPASLNHALPARLSRLIMALLAKNPADRPSSAQAVAEELGAIGRPATPAKAVPVRPLVSPRRGRSRTARWPILAAVAGGFILLLLVCLGGTALVWVRSRDSTDVARHAEAPAVGKGTAKATAPDTADDRGFVPLFNGKDLAGWFVEGGDPRAWDVANGEIIGWGKDWKSRSYLLTDRVYADFRLRLEFNLAKGAASAVALRALRGEQMPHPDHGQRINDHPLFKLVEPRSNEQTGTTHWVLNTAYAAPGQSAELRPAGEWNRLELEVKGRSLRGWVNGMEVMSAALAPGILLADGCLPALSRSRGRIGLQMAVGTVRYRNVQIKESPAAGGAAGSAKGFPVRFPEFDHAKWRIANGCLEQTSRTPNVLLAFGDRTWTNYDFSLEFLRAQGDCWLAFHLDPPEWKNFCLFGVCGEDNREQNLGGPVNGKWQLYAKKIGPVGNTWMRARVSVRGSHAQCFLNEQKLFDRKVTPHAGLAGIRTWGGVYQFRNIKVTDPTGKVLLEGLPDLDSAWSAEARSAAADGFIELFNGKDLGGWSVESGNPAQWSAEAGAIVGRSPDPTDRNYLLASRDYADFTLRLQFLLEPDSFGAIALRAIPGERIGDERLPDHPIIAVLDATKFKPPAPASGSAWWVQNGDDAFRRSDPAKTVPLSARTWHSLEVTMRAGRCTVTLNGIQIQDLERDTRKSSKVIPALERARGKIGFKVQVGTVRFRNIQIKAL